MTFSHALALATILAGFLTPALSATGDQAETRAMLAGGWRIEPDGSAPPACDKAPSEDGLQATFEFEVTGGKLQFGMTDDNDTIVPIKIGAADAHHVALATKGGSTVDFEIVSPGVMKTGTLAGEASGLSGKILRKCYEAADRSKIKVEHTPPLAPSSDIAFLSAGGLGEQPRFVDSRFGKGKAACDNPEEQYLEFDLVGPLGFKLGRYNTFALAEKLAEGQKPKVVGDDISDWTVEAVDPVQGGWKVTLTELIPPNGSRGDTTTVTVLAKGDVVSIPEWKREFRRCTNEDIVASP